MKKPRETAESLKAAINILHEYAHLGLIESHDMLQQMLNLSNMLLLSKENEMALQVLSTYEALVIEYEGANSFDYGVCELMHGVIALSVGNATEAEIRLHFNFVLNIQKADHFTNVKWSLFVISN